MYQISMLFGSAVLTAVLIVALHGFATRLGLVDRPGERKMHQGSVPMHGGLCMALVMLASGITLYLVQGLNSAEWVMLLGLALFMTIGVLDDLRDLSARLRLVVELLLLFWLMQAFDFRIENLGNLSALGDIHLGWIAWPFTLFTIFCLINGINMLDGMDGLAAGIVVICLAWFLLAAMVAGVAVSPLLWVMAGALLGFLFFNARAPWRRRAKVFMGDAGSLVLGFLLSWCCIAFTQQGTDASPAVLQPMTAVWILALPVIDTVYVVIRRARSGVGIFTPGRDHIHHRLQQLGFSDEGTVRLLWLVSAVLGGVGVGADLLQVPEVIMCYSFIALSIVYYLLASRMQANTTSAKA